jgi:hypothetical protein
MITMTVFVISFLKDKNEDCNEHDHRHRWKHSNSAADKAVGGIGMRHQDEALQEYIFIRN